MNTSLKNREPQLLVDLETGRVLRGDDNPTVTERYLDSHPFIAVGFRGGSKTYFAGPDAERAALVYAQGKPTAHLNVLQYDVELDASGYIRLQRVVEED